SDLAASQTKIQSLQDDLIGAEVQIQSLQSDYDKAKSDLEASQAEVQAAKERMLFAKTNADIVNALFVPAMTGELDEMSESEAMILFLEWRDKIMSAEDPLLLAKFDALIAAEFGDEQALDFFVYLFESIPEILE
ncbi:unnamed protein product, partial [marine sediment metagenome]